MEISDFKYYFLTHRKQGGIILEYCSTINISDSKTQMRVIKVGTQ